TFVHRFAWFFRVLTSGKRRVYTSIFKLAKTATVGYCRLLLDGENQPNRVMVKDDELLPNSLCFVMVVVNLERKVVLEELRVQFKEVLRCENQIELGCMPLRVLPLTHRKSGSDASSPTWLEYLHGVPAGFHSRRAKILRLMPVAYSGRDDVPTSSNSESQGHDEPGRGDSQHVCSRSTGTKSSSSSGATPIERRCKPARS
ncbi:unnamed protein product, partial [Allacma fusca]